MRNLVIIGNGFDLAHNLKTRYKEFINEISINPDKYEIEHTNIERNKLISVLQKNKDSWSDIEQTYYDILINFNKKNYLNNNFGVVWQYKTINELNQDFDEIKDWLSRYLSVEESNFEINRNFEYFFDALNKQESVILNFNYTKTVKEYVTQKNLDIEVIQIHGELNNNSNPLIFGFAASNEESKTLLNTYDNNFVRNIKKFNYLFTNNENILKQKLSSKEFNLFVLGHSCGLSDKLILNQIFNSDGIVKIYPFYYNDIMGYFETMVNIDRIIDDYSKLDEKKKSFTKLVSYPDAYQTPQMEFDKQFCEYIDKILKTKLPQEIAAENQKRAIMTIQGR